MKYVSLTLTEHNQSFWANSEVYFSCAPTVKIWTIIKLPNASNFVFFAFFSYSWNKFYKLFHRQYFNNYWNPVWEVCSVLDQFDSIVGEQWPNQSLRGDQETKAPPFGSEYSQLSFFKYEKVIWQLWKLIISFLRFKFKSCSIIKRDQVDAVAPQGKL